MNSIIKFSARLILAICVLIPNVSFGNAGVFSGSGQTPKLVDTSQIQLVEETVRITPEIRSIDLNGVSKGKAYFARYNCDFKLKNLTDRALTIQVGFPLNSQFFNSPYLPEEGHEMVDDYKFVAKTSAGKIFKPEWKPRDDQRKFLSILLWEMAFEPQQTILLNISYELPFSIGLSSTARDRQKDFNSPKKWYQSLSFSVQEGFEYVTETGKSWAGSIDKATFQVDLKTFENALRADGFYFGPDSKANEMSQILRTLYRQVEPGGWRESAGILEWQFDKYSPGEPIRILYFPNSIPNSVEHCKKVLPPLLGDKPSKEDLMDFREIVAAYYGEVPVTDRVKAFVDNQIWFPNSKVISADSKAVIDYIDSLIKAADAGA